MRPDNEPALAPQRSTKPQLLVVSTRAAAGTALAQAVTSWLASNDAAFPANDRPPDLLIREALSRPAVQIVAFVDHPESVLAPWLERGDAGSSDDALVPWRADARVLLKNWHGHPGRFMLIDADEARLIPQAIEPALKKWCPALKDMPTLEPRTTAAPADPLLCLVAHEMLRSNDEVTNLFEELHACCVALAPPEGGAAGDPAREALGRYRELRKTEVSIVSLREDLLLSQIHDLQQEAKAQYLRAGKLEQELAGAAIGSLPPLRTAEIRVMHTVESQPHRHLHFLLSQVRIGDRSLSSIQARLVEHAGRPGLALFGAEDGKHALCAWQPHGHEGKHAFMLLMPADDALRETLQHLGTSDWHLVVSLAHELRRHVCAAAGQLAAHWRTTAVRLCRQLDDMKERLRYDELAVSAAPEGALDVTLKAALFGRRPLGTVRLRWQPRRGMLQWLAGSEREPVVPLTPWPVDADGQLVPVETLPVGPGMDAADKRRRWEQMSEADRNLVTSVVDALIAAARKAPASTLPKEAAVADLERAARALHADLRATARRLRGRILVRRLLRRSGLQR